MEAKKRSKCNKIKGNELKKKRMEKEKGILITE